MIRDELYDRGIATRREMFGPEGAEKQTGSTTEEIRELLLHSILYCGIPAAADGFRKAEEVLDDVAKA